MTLMHVSPSKQNNQRRLSCKNKYLFIGMQIFIKLKILDNNTFQIIGKAQLIWIGRLCV